MKESQQLEKEIFVCEVIIKQLEKCLGIFLNSKNKNKQHIKSTIKDMQIMKAELRRLNGIKDAAKDAVMGAGKGAAMDHDELSKRSSKTVSQ